MKKSPPSMESRIGRILAACVALFVLGVAVAPAAAAAPTLEVSQLTGLKDGQKVTISGAGFQAGLSGIAIGQCKAGYKGPADCNTATGATFKNADGSGSVGTLTIIVKEKFGTTDCTKVQCVIAAAPLPTAAAADVVKANEVIHNISFGAPEAPATEAATQPVADQPAATETPAASGDELPKTGAGDVLVLSVVGGGALVLLSGLVLAATRRGHGVAR